MSVVLVPPRPVVVPIPITPPAAQLPPQPLRLTLKDYRALAETGFLNDK